MPRLHVLAEGQTEETYTKSVLVPHLAHHRVWVDVRCVQTGRKGTRRFRGGITSYDKVRNDLRRWIAEDDNADSWFTTMLDLYRLPEDFPDFDEARRFTDPLARVRQLEEAFGTDIAYRRFVPHLQLHEFEALIFARPEALRHAFPDADRAIGGLVAMAAEAQSPEHIDDGEDTAPSERIIAAIAEYEGRKASAGPSTVGHIGLDRLREACPHFGEWLSRLEGLSGQP